MNCGFLFGASDLNMVSTANIIMDQSVKSNGFALVFRRYPAALVQEDISFNRTR